MNKLGSFVLSSVLLFSAFGSVQANTHSHPSSHVQKSSMTVTLNGKELTFSQPPKNVNGNLLVPFRVIAEAVGAEVGYDTAQKTVKVTKGANSYALPIGGKTAVLNGVAVPLDVPAQIEKDVTLVPLRFVSESLGLKVEYDQATQTVALTSDDAPSVKLLSPSQDAILYTDKVKVAVAAFNHELTDFRTNTQPKEAQGHVHVWLDTDVTNPKLAYKMINGEPAVFENVQPGKHTVTVQLVGNDHKPISPESKQVITFTTALTPSIQITGPKEGETINGDKVTVTTSVSHFKLDDFRTNNMVAAGEGHVHIWLDRNVNDPKAAYKQVNGNPAVFDHVKPGNHTLTVQLVGANHKPILPEVKQVVHFTTKATPQKAMPAKAAPKTYAVNISGYAFKPGNLTVETGATVTFTNSDDVSHTVTDQGGTFDSGSLAKGKTFSKTFSKAGVYNIYCKPHNFMVATITVK
ncbi:stalk domain-containing protein [Brevibacillus sp. SYSU BS000544]|uniref:stalk domain-containing protein n=1 Tax=Brevibacillus sp. SYSU BS000544 TaxID=3416443 RepID=UPI003CE4E47B